MNIGVAKVFQTGVKQKKWLMVAFVQLYFCKLKGKLPGILFRLVHVARATLCHTLATPLLSACILSATHIIFLEMCNCYRKPSEAKVLFCSVSGNYHFTYFNYQLQPLHIMSFTFMSLC